MGAEECAVTEPVKPNLLIACGMGEVAHPPQQPARDARRTARALRDLVCAIVRHADAEHASATVHD